MTLPEKYKDTKIVYEDDVCIAILSTAVNGHIKIFTKSDAKIIDDVSSDEVSHMFFVSSFAATCAFESLGMQGTNIIVNNEDDKFCIDVVPRKEGDSLKLNWEVKQGNPAELDEIAKRISDETFMIGKENKSKSADVKVEEPKQSDTVPHDADEKLPAPPKEFLDEDEEITKGEDKEENYLLSELRRIP